MAKNMAVVAVTNTATGQVQQAFLLRHRVAKMVVAWPASPTGQMVLVAQQGGGFAYQNYMVYGGNVTC